MRYSLEKAKANPRKQFGRRYVLVFEDNVVNQKLAVRMLKKLATQ